jgi:hypothetical protein
MTNLKTGDSISESLSILNRSLPGKAAGQWYSHHAIIDMDIDIAIPVVATGVSLAISITTADIRNLVRIIVDLAKNAKVCKDECKDLANRLGVAYAAIASFNNSVQRNPSHFKDVKLEAYEMALGRFQVRWHHSLSPSCGF